MLTGLIFDIQRYSLHDGPGIRTTVFLKGCPATCWWCHNPESQSPRPQILVLEARCLGCGSCIDVCPHGAPVAARPAPADTLLRCTLCERCVEICPSGARSVAGQSMTVTEVMADILRDRIFYDDSGGGVTFSGGEPLLQYPFLREVLQACRDEGLHTAVDTCGFAPGERLLGIAPLTDLFLYDLKIMDPERHVELTGVSNAPILENLRALGAVHSNIWIRVPIIPGFNDDAENVLATARFVAKVPGVKQVNLLPYHPTGARKFDRVGRSYRLADIAPPGPQHMEELARVFRDLGLRARTGGASL